MKLYMEDKKSSNSNYVSNSRGINNFPVKNNFFADRRKGAQQQIQDKNLTNDVVQGKFDIIQMNPEEDCDNIYRDFRANLTGRKLTTDQLNLIVQTIEHDNNVACSVKRLMGDAEAGFGLYEYKFTHEIHPSVYCCLNVVHGTSDFIDDVMGQNEGGSHGVRHNSENEIRVIFGRGAHIQLEEDNPAEGHEAEQENATHWCLNEDRSMGAEQSTDINVDTNENLDPVILGSATNLQTYVNILALAKKMDCRIRCVAYEFLPGNIWNQEGIANARQGLELLRSFGTQDYTVDIFGIDIPGLLD